jgi:hypothetical protein
MRLVNDGTEGGRSPPGVQARERPGLWPMAGNAGRSARCLAAASWRAMQRQDVGALASRAGDDLVSTGGPSGREPGRGALMRGPDPA